MDKTEQQLDQYIKELEDKLAKEKAKLVVPEQVATPMATSFPSEFAPKLEGLEIKAPEKKQLTEEEQLDNYIESLSVKLVKEKLKDKVRERYKDSPVTSTIENAIDKFTNAYSFGLAKPVRATGRAIGQELVEAFGWVPEEDRQSFFDNYQKSLDEIEAEEEVKEEEAGKGKYVGSALGLIGELRRFGEVAKLTKGALAGASAATQGAGLIASESTLFGLYGIADSEHRLSRGEVAEVALDAGINAGIGAAGGAVLAGMGSVVRHGYNKLSKKSAGYITEGIKSVGKDLDKEVARKLARNAEAEQAAKDFLFKGNVINTTNISSVKTFNGFLNNVNRNTRNKLAELADKHITKESKQFVVDLLSYKAARMEAAKATTEVERRVLNKALSSATRPQLNRISKQVVRRAEQNPEQLARDYAAYTLARDNVLGFAKYQVKKGAKLGDKVLLDELGSMAARETASSTFLSRGYELYRYNKNALEFFSDNAIVEDVSQGMFSKFSRRLAMKMADARYVYSAIDDKWGTKLAPILDSNISAGWNLYTLNMYSTVKQLKPLYKQAKKLGMLTTKFDKELKIEVPKLYSAIRNPEYRAKLQGKQKEIVDKYIKLWEDMRQSAESYGVNIDKLDNYVRYAPKGREEYVASVKTAVKEMGVDPKKITDKQFNELKDIPEFGEVLKAMQLLKGPTIRDAKSFQKVYNELNKVTEGYMLADTVEVSAAFAREAENIPKFVQETDVNKLMQAWAHNTFKTIHLREGTQELRTAARTLKSVDSNAYNYIKNHIDDMLGTRTSAVAGAYNQMVLQAKSSLQSAIDTSSGVKRQAYKALKTMPDFMSFMGKQIYPAVLGLNAKAIIRNMTQPYMLTAGEVSGIGKWFSSNTRYAYTKATKAQAETLAMYAQGIKARASKEMAKALNVKPFEEVTFRGLTGGMQFLQNQGQLPIRVTFEAMEEVQKQLTKLGAQSADTLATYAMWGYTMSDMHNRLVTYNMARSVTKDIISGLKKGRGDLLNLNEKAAADMIKSVDPGYRTLFREQIVKWRSVDQEVRPLIEEEIHKSMATYLISKTQFQYNRVSMSEFGREMGTAFSMFTKWPFSITADMTNLVKQHGTAGAAKAARKYFGPWASMWALGKLVFDEQSDRVDKFVGRGGLESWTPITAAYSFIDGDFARSPIVEAVGAGTRGIMAADDKKRQRIFERLFRQWTPGVAWPRFFLEDLPTAATGEDPKTLSEFFEQTWNAIPSIREED